MPHCGHESGGGSSQPAGQGEQGEAANLWSYLAKPLLEPEFEAQDERRH